MGSLYVIGALTYLFFITIAISRRWEDRCGTNRYMWDNEFLLLVWLGGVLGTIIWPLALVVLSGIFVSKKILPGGNNNAS